MNATPNAARLERPLVDDLSKANAILAEVIGQVHEYCDFFSRAASAPFAVPVPAALRERGAHVAQVSMSRFHLFHRVLILRTAALLAGAVRSLNGSRLLEFALAARGVLETAGAAAYHGPRLAIPADATTLPDGYDERLQSAVMGSRFDWMEFSTDHAARLALIEEFDAASDLKSLWPEGAAANILTMLEALARRLKLTAAKARGVIFLDYSLLSDLCHPAAGSYLLFLTELEPKLRADLVPPRETVLGIATQVLPCVGYSALAVIGILAELEEVERQLERLAALPPPSAGPAAGGAAREA